MLFIAGLGLHLSELVESSKPAVLAGSLGFVFTVGMGYLLAQLFAFETQQALFIGLMLAPTSIGISAQTLMELKMLRTMVGTTLLGAAAIDDILGVLGVSVFLALFLGRVTNGFDSILVILVKMILYLVVASAIGIWLMPKAARFIEKLPISQGLIAFAFVTLLLFAWTAEVFGQMAAIIGAFLAGIFLASSPLQDKIERGLLPIAYGIFVPIFFVNVGLSADIRQISIGGVLLLVGMTIVVIFSKLVGAGIGGRLGGLTNRESVQLGAGMIPRGEVVLIVATVGITEGLIGSDVFSAVVLLVIVTTLITPLILRSMFSGN